MIHSKYVQVHIERRVRGEKSFIRCVRTKLMAPSKCCGIFFVQGLAKYTRRASSRARKMLLYFFIIIKSILSYAIIRI